jgi:hypothetical protein
MEERSIEEFYENIDFDKITNWSRYPGDIEQYKTEIRKYINDIEQYKDDVKKYSEKLLTRGIKGEHNHGPDTNSI